MLQYHNTAAVTGYGDEGRPSETNPRRSEARWQTVRADVIIIRQAAPCIQQEQNDILRKYYLRNQIKGKIVPVHAKKAYRLSGGVDPPIFNLDFKRRRVVTFTPRPLEHIRCWVFDVKWTDIGCTSDGQMAVSDPGRCKVPVSGQTAFCRIRSEMINRSWFKQQNSRVWKRHWLKHEEKIIKLSRYRPGWALGVPGGWGFRISRQLAHNYGKVASPTHQPSSPPGRIPGTHFC